MPPSVLSTKNCWTIHGFALLKVQDAAACVLSDPAESFLNAHASQLSIGDEKDDNQKDQPWIQCWSEQSGDTVSNTCAQDVMTNLQPEFDPIQRRQLYPPQQQEQTREQRRDHIQSLRLHQYSHPPPYLQHHQSLYNAHPP